MKNKIINKYKQNKRDYNIIVSIEAVIISVSLIKIFWKDNYENGHDSQ